MPSGPTLTASSRLPVGPFRRRIAGHYTTTEHEETFHFLDNRTHSPLLDLRIYPSLPGTPGRDPYANGCDRCGRPHRIFYAKFVRWIFDFETEGICSVCCWEKRNFPVLRLSLYRLWPVSGKAARTSIASCLCPHSRCAHFLHWNRHLYVMTPQTRSLLSEARRFTWHSLLLSGLRTALEECDVYEPHSLESLSQRFYTPWNYYWVTPKERWEVYEHLARNQLWLLFFSCCPTRAIMPDGTGGRLIPGVASVGRPLEIVLIMIGEHSRGQSPLGMKLVW